MNENQKKPEPTQEIKNLTELLKITNLNIPSYQRPYKWKEINVTNLLDDIYEHTINKKNIYRIGSLIIHNNTTMDVVDGQQRLTTISILLYKLLGANEKQLLLGQNYNHKISKENISYNSKVIENWLLKISDKKEDFKKQLLEKCEFVLFTVFDLDEAFQLFDSQNSRGKSLEAYDLLKAFHLREMRNDTENDQLLCVEQWEKSVECNTLGPMLSDHLFKIRKWSKNEKIYHFTKNDIDEFKGISLEKLQQYPFESSLRLLDCVVSNSQNNKVLKNFNISQNFPFAITMPIINGKRFFEYVEFYINQKNKLLNESNEFKNFYDKHCFYAKSWRGGDKKVRNLYENILLLFIDKFGYTKDFESYYKAFYKATYFIRCEKKSIRLETILFSEALNILREINESINPTKLMKYQIKQYKFSKQDTELAEGVLEIKNSINLNFIQNGN